MVCKLVAPVMCRSCKHIGCLFLLAWSNSCWCLWCESNKIQKLIKVVHYFFQSMKKQLNLSFYMYYIHIYACNKYVVAYMHIIVYLYMHKYMCLYIYIHNDWILLTSKLISRFYVCQREILFSNKFFLTRASIKIWILKLYVYMVYTRTQRWMIVVKMLPSQSHSFVFISTVWMVLVQVSTTKALG